VNPTRTINSRAEHDRLQDKMELRKKQRELDLKKQMETPQGRRFVFYVLDSLGWQKNILETNAAVYGRTAKQAVANDLVKELKKLSPENFMLMEIEAQE